MSTASPLANPATPLQISFNQHSKKLISSGVCHPSQFKFRLIATASTATASIRMKHKSHFERDVGKFEAENQARFEQLERDRVLMTQLAVTSGVVGVMALAAYPPAGIASFPALWKTAEVLSTLSLRFFLMPELMAAFEPEDVAIEVGLKPEGAKEIDFFLRFPDKEYVLIQVRPLGKSKLVYNEAKQAFQTRRRNKAGVKTWKTNPIMEFIEQERWIRRERTDLLGTSAKDRRRPFAKLLVLRGEDNLNNHPEHLYGTINDQKYLTIRNAGTIHIVPQERAVNFIKDYLTMRRSS